MNSSVRSLYSSVSEKKHAIILFCFISSLAISFFGLCYLKQISFTRAIVKNSSNINDFEWNVNQIEIDSKQTLNNKGNTIMLSFKNNIFFDYFYYFQLETNGASSDWKKLPESSYKWSVQEGDNIFRIKAKMVGKRFSSTFETHAKVNQVGFAQILNLRV